MRLLVDTHVAVWSRVDDHRLGSGALEALLGPHEIVLSAVVPLEVAIKRSLGKLRAPDDLVEGFRAAGATLLPVTHAHAAAVERLPWHHRDPFDRLLVAQAQLEDATVVTADPRFAAYGVPVLWD